MAIDRPEVAAAPLVALIPGAGMDRTARSHPTPRLPHHDPRAAAIPPPRHRTPPRPALGPLTARSPPADAPPDAPPVPPAPPLPPTPYSPPPLPAPDTLVHTPTRPLVAPTL